MLTQQRHRTCSSRRKHSRVNHAADNLSAVLAKLQKRDPTALRQYFSPEYCEALILEQKKQFREAIPLYESRASDGAGSAEEAAHARYHVALCKLRLRQTARPLTPGHFKDAEMFDFMKAFSLFGQKRLEPLYHIINYFRLCKAHKTALAVGELGKHLLEAGPPAGGRFIEPDIYDYKFMDELCIVAYWAGNTDLSHRMGVRLFNTNRYPLEKEGRLWKNLKFSVNRLKRPANIQVPCSALDLRTVRARWINRAASTKNTARIFQLLTDLGFADAECVEVPDTPDGRAGGLAVAHLKILEDTIAADKKPVLILEDGVDVKSLPDAIARCSAVSCPDAAEAFYMGERGEGTPLARPSLFPMGRGVYRIKNVLRMPAVLYLSSGYAREVIKSGRAGLEQHSEPLDWTLAFNLQHTHRVYSAQVPVFCEHRGAQPVAGETKAPDLPDYRENNVGEESTDILDNLLLELNNL